MKRIKPLSDYRTGDYPTAKEAGETRRSFLRAALSYTGAAALGVMAGGTAVSCSGSSGRRHDRTAGTAPMPRYHVAIALAAATPGDGCNKTVTAVRLLTHNHKLATFLRDKKELPGVQRAIETVVKSHGCAVLQEASGPSTLKIAVASAILERFKKIRREKYAPMLSVRFTIRATPPS